MWKILNYRAGTSAEVLIYGEIGADEFGVDASDFYSEVAAIDAPEITFRINSYGGDVFTGTTIYNQIRRLPALTTTTVDGVAASIASVIAMAGDRMTMAPNAMLMIHNAWTSVAVAGDANVFEESADEIDRMTGTLRAIDENIIQAYANKTSASVEQLKAWMDAETWFTAEEAVRFGFADAITDHMPAVAASYSWCYVPSGRYKNTPRHLVEAQAATEEPLASSSAALRSQSQARLRLASRVVDVDAN